MTYTMTTPLQQAAAALMDAMDQTDFTCRLGEQLDALEKALEAEQAHAVEPAAWGMMKNGLMLDIICPDEHESFEGDYTIPLYTHPAPPLEYDQQAMELCEECGWKAIMPGEPCFVCNMKTEVRSEFDMRGVLASNLLCWHRLTEAEAQDLICFFEKVCTAEAKQAQAAEPHGWMICGLREVMSEHHAKAEQAQHQAMGGTAVAYPIYTHPSPPATGERAELIDMCATAEANAFTEENRNFYKSMKDMLEADAQEIEGWKADQKENLCNQVELQGRINDLKAQQLAVTAWKAEQIDYFEIRVTSPDGRVVALS